MKRFVSFLMIVALALTGCAEKKAAEDNDLSLYYINQDATQVVPVGYDFTGEKGDIYSRIDEILSVMTESTGEIEYVRAIPEGVDISTYYLRDDILVLYFDYDYMSMDPVTEILCRLALVSTFSQLEGINGIEIFVDSEPLRDIRGDEIGVIRPDSFVENPGEQINSINRSSVTLYFANEDAQSLVREYQTVYYNSSIPLEKILMEQLIAGPKTDGLLATIPAGTKLTSITTVDGICYVSLDSGFSNQNYEIPEQIVIYSIVNSLCSIGSIEKVQISINGDTSRVYRDAYELSRLYEADPTLVSTQIKSKVVTEEGE